MEQINLGNNIWGINLHLSPWADRRCSWNQLSELIFASIYDPINEPVWFSVSYNAWRECLK